MDHPSSPLAFICRALIDRIMFADYGTCSFFSSFFAVDVQKWHPDKHKGDTAVTAKFQDINEAYTGEFLPDNK